MLRFRIFVLAVVELLLALAGLGYLFSWLPSSSSSDPYIDLPLSVLVVVHGAITCFYFRSDIALQSSECLCLNSTNIVPRLFWYTILVVVGDCVAIAVQSYFMKVNEWPVPPIVVASIFVSIFLILHILLGRYLYYLKQEVGIDAESERR